MTASTPDRFAAVRAATDRHRRSHSCHAYPFADGALLGTVSAAVQPRRILELGTALGYTALWLAYGAPAATVDTIEADPDHVALARDHLQAHGMADRVTVHQGDFATVVSGLSPGYDLGFFDGYTPEFDHLAAFARLLRPRGTLITTNLSHGGTGAYRAALFESGVWLSAFIDADRDTALSVGL